MTRPAPSLAPALLVYTAARLGLIAVVAGVLLVAGVPLLLALLIGLIVALPLSMVLLKGPRARLDAALAASGARRSAERDALRARLRGNDPDEPGPASRGPRPTESRSADQSDDGAGLERPASERAAEAEPERGGHRPAE